MLTCRSCEKELTKDANFCSNCGLRTEKGENDNVKTPVDRRPEWEKELESALQKASNVLEEAFNSARKGLREVTEEVKTEMRARTRVFCPNCGAKNYPDSDYCTKCGTKIDV